MACERGYVGSAYRYKLYIENHEGKGK